MGTTAVEIVPVSCETDGIVRHTASVEFGNASVMTQEDQVIAHTGHNWDLEGDYYPLTPGVRGDDTIVTIYCRNDQTHTLIAVAHLEEVEAKYEPPTCTEPGKRVVVMTYTVDDVEHTLEEVAYEIPAAGHRWGPNGKCTVCGAEEGAETAGGTWHLPEPTDEARVQWSQPPMGGTPYVTVTAWCEDSNGKLIRTQSYVLYDVEIDDKAPTCEEDGATTYTASMKLGSEEKTYTLTQTRRAHGHWWKVAGEPEWSKDNTTVTFQFQCRWDSKHKDSMTANTTSTVRQEPTCTEQGWREYTAVGQMGGTTTSVTKAEPIPALGHSFKDGKCTRCGAKDPDYVKPTAKPSVAPDTGDETHLLPWAVMLIGCCCALAAAAVLRRRRAK